MPGKTIIPGLKVEISRDFSVTYPGASVGILVLENINSQSQDENLDDIKREIILDLQKIFPDQNTLKEHPVIQAYSRYYKKFDKSYHVLGQLKSVIFEHRPLPVGSAIVEALFTAELKNMLLTAIHDLDSIKSPLEIGISTGEEIYTTLKGNEQRLKPGDMIVSDQDGVISSVIYGPDKRTCVTPSTLKVLMVVYAPDGIKRENIMSHFEDLENIVRITSPQFKETMKTVYPNDLKR